MPPSCSRSWTIPKSRIDNNHRERQNRPAEIAQKNSYANGSQDGAGTQTILMSVLRILRQRGQNPISAITEVVRVYVRTGQLPPLPNPIAEIA